MIRYRVLFIHSYYYMIVQRNNITTIFVMKWTKKIPKMILKLVERERERDREREKECVCYIN